MPFGLTMLLQLSSYNESGFFNLFEEVCHSFFDDILVYSASMTEHMHHLKTILQSLLDIQLFSKMSKCKFSQDSIEYLEYIIFAKGVKSDPKKFKL